MANVDSLGSVLCMEVARLAVAEIATDELEFFEDFVGQQISAPRIRDEALAFGVSEALQLLTPTVLGAVMAAVTFAAPKLFETVLDIGKDLVREKISKRLKERPASPSIKEVDVSFTPDQLRLVRERAHEYCIAAGLRGERADQVADAVVARLATL